jgi:hypothetical protein
MDVQIAIPSYRRHELIKERTLSMLEDGCVDKKSIHIFVSSKDEEKNYEYLKDEGYNVVYEKELSNLQEKNNFILDYFGVGQRIVVIEDDIRKLVRKKGNSKVPFSDFPALMRDAWQSCKDSGAKIWGINPTDNGLYMKDRIDTTLKLVAGYLYGVEITSDRFLRCGTETKHDYERTLLHYIRHGAVIRIDYIGQQSYSFKEKGGLQNQYSVEARIQREQDGCQYLLRRFPHLVRKHHRWNREMQSDTELLLESSVSKSKDTRDLYALQKLLDIQNGYL